MLDNIDIASEYYADEQPVSIPSEVAMPPTIDVEEQAFIAEIYKHYFNLKVMHWNTGSLGLHKIIDQITSKLLELMDDYVELLLAPLDDAKRFAVIQIDDFRKALSASLSAGDSCEMSMPYNDVVAVILLISKVLDNLEINLTDSKAAKTSKKTLLETYLEEFNKLLYLYNKF